MTVLIKIVLQSNVFRITVTEVELAPSASSNLMNPYREKCTILCSSSKKRTLIVPAGTQVCTKYGGVLYLYPPE